MVKSLVTVMLAAALLNGCSGKNREEGAPKALPNNETMMAPTDNRMSDPAILAADQDLRQGDIGVDHGRLQALQAPLLPVYPNPSIPPVNGSYVNNVISFGSLFLGTPYEYGSDRDDPSTFDCSDFTRYAYLGALGMDLPKDSRRQADYVNTFGKRSYRNLSQARPGDLLFFTDYNGPHEESYRNVSSDSSISHCGIYMGNGNVLHTASKATGGVRIDYIYGKHLEWRFVEGGSVLP